MLNRRTLTVKEYECEHVSHIRRERRERGEKEGGGGKRERINRKSEAA